MPFPSARTIHPDWSRHHRPVVEGTLTGRCTITVPAPGGGNGGWTPEHGATAPDPAAAATGPLHAGPFRAQAVNVRQQPRDAAGQTVAVRSYLWVLPSSAPEAPVGARITVDECPDDPSFVGKVLTVTGVTHATHRFEWDLYADLDLTNQPTGEA